MTCTHCDAPTPPGIHLCHNCATRLGEVLDQIPDALTDSLDTIAKQDTRGTGARSGGNGPTQSVAPINLPASMKRATLWEHVVSWSRWVLAEDDRAEPMPSDPAEYLRASVQVIRRHDWAGDLMADLTDDLAAVLRAVDVPPDVISLGRCGVVIEGQPCPGALRAVKGRNSTTCKACGTRHDVRTIQQERIDAAWHATGTLSEVVRALNLMGIRLKQRTADQWVTRGKLRTPWQRADGVRLYTPAQVREVMVAQEQKQKAKQARRVS